MSFAKIRSLILACLLVSGVITVHLAAQGEAPELALDLIQPRPKGMNLHTLVHGKIEGNSRLLLGSEATEFWQHLRLGLMPHVIGRGDERIKNRCDHLKEGFAPTLDRIQEAIDFLDWRRAEETLVEAKFALSCDPKPVAAFEVARMHFLRGVLALERGDVAPSHFETALSIAHDYAFPWDYSPAVQEAFELARKSVIARPFIPVEYVDDLAGLLLTIDGRPPGHYGPSLRKGAHYLQLMTRDRVVLRRGLMDIRLNRKGDLPNIPGADLQPPSQAFITQVLLNQVQSGLLDEDYAELVANYLNKHGAQTLTLVGEGAGWRSLYRVRVNRDVGQRGGVISWP